MGSLGSTFSGGPPSGTAVVRLETEPPGAEARASSGQTCRTPCSLAISARGDFTVNFSLNGYLPQAVTASILTAEDTAGDPSITTSTAEARVVPNPIFAALELAPPPPPQRRRPAPRPKPRVSAPPPPSAGPAPIQQPLTPFPTR